MNKILSIVTLFVLMVVPVSATTILVPQDYPTIQAGIDTASNGDSVLVSAGIYVENINYIGKNIAVIGEDRETTIIDGNQNGSVVIFNSGEDSTAVLSGFTITNGSAYDGGGIYCWESNLTISDVIIIDNISSDDAGGNGAGIYCNNSSLNLNEVIIVDNYADTGGGISCYNSNLNITNLTISNNYSTMGTGGGIACDNSNINFVNSILWNNSPQEIYIEAGSVTAIYSDIQGGWEGEGNINTNPLFCNAYSGDYTLAEDSPCVGTGEYGANMGALDVGCEAMDSTLTITEIMQNPSSVSDANGEWFEIYNLTRFLFNLNGWTISDHDNDSHTINSDLELPPLGFAVLGNNSDYATNGGVNIDYEYDDISLGNGSDELILISPEGTISDTVAWDDGETFPDQSGASMALIDTELDNNVGSNWTVSTTSFGDGDLGTPGFPNFFSDIDVSVNSLEFDTTAVGNNISQNITIFNTGIAVLTIDSVYATGDAFQPSLTNASVDADSSLTFTITFTPDDYGNYSETLIILSNDNDEPSVSIALSGFGYIPVSHIDISTNSLSFPNTMVGLTSSMELTIFNVGEELLVVDTIYSNLPDSLFSSFIPSSSEMSIEVGESVVCEITFVPQEIQEYIGQLTITNNDPDNSTLSVSLSGSGVEPDADIYVEQDTLDFGNVDVGTLPLVIRNIGLEDLEIEEVEFGMGNESPFSTDFENATLEAGDSVIVEISFYYFPDRTVLEDVLSIYSNDPEYYEWSVILMAENAPNIDMSHSDFFVQLNPGNSSTYTLTISNVGTVNLEAELIISPPPVYDIDGNIYATVEIGDQIWMAENLKVTHYRNGEEIPTGYNNSEWHTLSTGAYAVYDDNSSNAEIYGNLYNGYALTDSRSIAPEGWHVPTDNDWQTLFSHIDGSAGGKLKESGTEHWFSPNTGANNESNFTALPGGYRFHYNGEYSNMGYYGYFGSTSTCDWEPMVFWRLSYNNSEVAEVCTTNTEGVSVRCVKDMSNRPIDYLKSEEVMEFGELSYRTNSLEEWSNDNFRQTIREEWLSLSTDTLILLPQSSEDIYITFDATNLEVGEYRASIMLITNVPDKPVIVIPVTLEVDSTSSIMEIEIDNLAGWNLVGLPLEVEDPYYLTIFPDATENTLYSFDETYVLDSTLVQGAGYWLRFDTTGTTTITGNPIDELTISLSEGWNMISALHEDLSIYSINDPDSTIVPNTMYGFSETYFLTETLVPGKGYWLRAYQDGEVTITGDGLARITPQDFSLNDWGNTLTINGMDLYFGIELTAKERLSYSLPPKPPLGAFDVRFKGDTRVTKESAEIEIMNTTETLTIAYDIKIDAGEHMNWVLTSENGKDYILEGSGELTVPSAETFILNRESVIPITFALHQNYPNPFNPITTLRYDLPSDAFVTLTVYDMLGKEITQLVKTTQLPGFKSVQWDATDSMGRPVSAGVYLYQIQAGEFVQTKKMVLLK